MAKTSLQEYVEQLLAHLGIQDAQVSLEENEQFVSVHIEVSEEESGMLIGYHGETIASLQRVLSVSFFDELQDKKVILNVNNYKQKREEVVQNMAKNMAEQVVQSGQPMTLPYLPSNERLIVHTTLKDFSGVETHSEGEGDQRRLVISPLLD